MAASLSQSQSEAASEADSLRALEGLMEEFYSPGTSNARKQEIQTMLDNFGSQAECWRQCLAFMEKTSSHYVCMFALNTLEVSKSILHSGSGLHS